MSYIAQVSLQVPFMWLFLVLANLLDSPDFMDVARLVRKTKKKEKLLVEAEVSSSFLYK